MRPELLAVEHDLQGRGGSLSAISKALALMHGATGWTEYELITIYRNIYDEFGFEPEQMVKDKIAAIKLFHDPSEAFYHSAMAFLSVVLAANSHEIDGNVFELVSPSDILVAFYDLEPDTKKFEREVYGYIRVCMQEAGVLRYPEPLAFAQPIYPPPLDVLAASIKPFEGAEYDPRNPVETQGAKLFTVVEEARRRHSPQTQSGPGL